MQTKTCKADAKYTTAIDIQALKPSVQSYIERVAVYCLQNNDDYLVQITNFIVRFETRGLGKISPVLLSLCCVFVTCVFTENMSIRK